MPDRIFPKPRGVARPLKDVRYFDADTAAFDTMPAYAQARYPLPLGPSAALGQRIGYKCEELGICIGRANHLYVVLVPDLVDGQVQVSPLIVEPWFVFVACGVPVDFGTRTGSEQLEWLEKTTFAAIRVLTDQHDRVAEAQVAVREGGDDLAIQRLCKIFRRIEVRVMFSIAAHPAPSKMWLRVTDRTTGETRDLTPWLLRFGDDVFSLAGRLTLEGNTLTLWPRPSFRAGLTASDYPIPMRIDIVPPAER